MRKILLLIIILYNLRNSFADATNDSIKNYLTSNIKYPTINSENNLIGSVLLLLNKPSDSTLKYQILTTTKFVAFEYETFRVIKQSAFLKLIPKNKNVFVKINFKIVDIDTSLISQNDTVLADKQIMLDLNENDFIVIDKVIGEIELRQQDSLINLYRTNQEQIWQSNSDTILLSKKDKSINKKQLKSSKMIIRLKDDYSYFSTNFAEYKEISISAADKVIVTKYHKMDNDLLPQVDSKVLTKQSVTLTNDLLNKIRCLPNQPKHRSRICDGDGWWFEIFYKNRYRKYFYGNPRTYSKKEKSKIDAEAVRLFDSFILYFK